MAGALLSRLSLALAPLGLGLLGVGPGCGAQGTEAPYVIHPDEDVGACPGADEALGNTRDALREGSLGALGPHVERILVDDGGLRVLVPSLLEVTRSIPPSRALSVSAGYSEGRGLARLRPHFRQVIDYIEGESAYIEGEHYGLLDVSHAVLAGQGAECDPQELLTAVRRILLLRVPGPDGQERPWIEPAFDAVVALVEDEVFQEQLGRLAFDDAGGRGRTDGGPDDRIVVGREAFVLVFQLAIGNLSRPDFDLDYVRDLLETFLTGQLDEQTATQEKVRAVLDQLEILYDPALEVQEPLMSTLACLRAVDDPGHGPAMIYDYLSIEELSLDEFLRDLDAFGDDAAGQALRTMMEDGGAVLEADPGLTRDLLSVLNRFLEPEATREVVPAVAALQGTGVLTEILTFAESLVHGCDEAAVAAAPTPAPDRGAP